MSLLEQNTKRKGSVDDENTAAKLDAGNESGKYKIEAIRDSAVHMKESESGHLPGLYYLVLWKRYPKEENIWEPASAVQQLRKLISSFHKNYPDKPTATFSAIDTVPLMARPIVKLAEPPKQKQRQQANSTNKRAKKRAAFDFYSVFGGIWVTSKFDDLSHIVYDCTWLLANHFSQKLLLLDSFIPQS